MSEKILVIDDNEVIQKMVQARLSREGYLIVTARDGDSGIALSKEEKPDLILLDVQMPGKNGYTVCRELRESEETKDTPIIMLTALSGISSKQAGFEAGADDYITKPFDNAELMLRIKANLRRKSSVQYEERQSRIITILTLRGGAGSSLLATNLATGLSQMWDTGGVLVDLAMPIGLCDIMLNLKPKNGLSTLIGADISEISLEMIEGCLVKHESGARFLRGIARPEEADIVSENFISFLLENLRMIARYVVIDTAHNFLPANLAALDASDLILMPIMPDINSVRLAVGSLRVFDALGYPRDKIQVIVNWTFPKNGLSLKRVEQFIKHPVSMVIPHDPESWNRSINLGKPLITSEEKSPLIDMMEDFVWRLSLPEDQQGTPVRPTPMWERTHVRRVSREEGRK